MKLYAKINLKKHVERARRHPDFNGIHLSEMAEKLTKKYGVPVTRAYIGWYCKTRNVPTFKPVLQTNPCEYCGKDVSVNGKDRPYTKHRECELEATMISLVCDSRNCTMQFQRPPSAINEDRNYCSYPCFNEERKIQKEEREALPV